MEFITCYDLSPLLICTVQNALKKIGHAEFRIHEDDLDI